MDTRTHRSAEKEWLSKSSPDPIFVERALRSCGYSIVQNEPIQEQIRLQAMKGSPNRSAFWVSRSSDQSPPRAILWLKGSTSEWSSLQAPTLFVHQEDLKKAYDIKQKDLRSLGQGSWIEAGISWAGLAQVLLTCPVGAEPAAPTEKRTSQPFLRHPSQEPSLRDPREVDF